MADVGVTSSTYLEIPQLTLNDIQDGTPVYIYYSTAAGNTAIAATDVSRIVTGNYFDAVHNLQNGIVAAWNFDTDTSGSSAYDWSGNGCTLTNSNGVQFVTSGTGYATAMTGAAARFSGSSGQVLVLNGPACPNLATMPAWTVSFWTNLTSGPGGYCGPFEVLDGTSVQLVAQGDTALASSGWDLVGAGGVPYAYANNGPRYSNVNGGGTQASPELGGHWMFYCIRKAVGGAFQVVESTYGGLIESTWSVPAVTMTGTNPVLVFGGRIDAGYVGSLNGYMDNIYIWKRCLSDHEVNLLWNPGTDGMPNQHYNDSFEWFWGGRAYPFNY
jgi:hypothetical protein